MFSIGRVQADKAARRAIEYNRFLLIEIQLITVFKPDEAATRLNVTDWICKNQSYIGCVQQRK